MRGLVINRFSADGISLFTSSVGGNVIVGNYIGTDVTGTARARQLTDGITSTRRATRSVVRPPLTAT